MKLAISYDEDLRLKPDNSKYRRVNMWRLHNGFNIEIFHVSSNFKPLLPPEYESIEKCIIKVMLWNHNPFLTHSAARTSQKSAMVPLWVFEYLGKKSPTDCVPRWSVPSKKIKKLKFQSTDWCSTKGGVPSNDEKVVKRRLVDFLVFNASKLASKQIRKKPTNQVKLLCMWEFVLFNSLTSYLSIRVPAPASIVNEWYTWIFTWMPEDKVPSFVLYKSS